MSYVNDLHLLLRGLFAQWFLHYFPVDDIGELFEIGVRKLPFLKTKIASVVGASTAVKAAERLSLFNPMFTLSNVRC